MSRAMARGQQPKDTCWDALNVLPFDRYKRLRIAQRPGSSETFSAVNGAVNGMIQVVLGQADAGWGTVATNFTNVEEAIESWSDPLNNPYEWGAGTSNTDTNNISTYLALFSGGRTGTWPSGGAPNFAPLEVGGLGATLFLTSQHDASGTITAGAVGSSAAFTTSSATAADNFYMLVNEVADYEFGIPTNRSTFFSVRSNASSPSTTTGMLTVQVDWVASSITLYQGSTQLATATGLDLSGQSSFAIEVSGSSVTVLTSPSINSDNTITGTPTITTTVTNDTTLLGIAVGQIWTDTTINPMGIGSIILGSGTSERPREIRLIATDTSGSVWVGDDPTSLVDIADGQLTAHSPGLTDVNGHVYLVDGTNTLDLDLSDNVIAPLSASAGSVPAGCRVARTWRGRLVLAAPDSGQQNFFMSRQGDPTDWDFSQPDPAAAFAGNASTSGRIGDIIIDIIPFSDDALWIMCDHSIWAVIGDPLDGGTIIPISPAIGIIGTNAWTLAPDGTVWFVGTGGLYHASSPRTQPQLVSATTYPQFFQGIDRKSNYFRLAYDRDNYGFWVFVTAIESGIGSTHLWADSRPRSFEYGVTVSAQDQVPSLFPQHFPDRHGPISALVWDGDGPSDRYILFGGRDGVIRKLDPTTFTDDGDAIEASVTLGPVSPSQGSSEAVLNGTTLDFGEVQTDGDPWGVSIQLNAGKTAYDVTEGTPITTATIPVILDRRQKTCRQRLKGAWFTIELSKIAFAVTLSGGIQNTVIGDVIQNDDAESETATVIGISADATTLYLNKVGGLGWEVGDTVENLTHTFMGSVTLATANDEGYFSFESGTLTFAPAGLNRRQR